MWQGVGAKINLQTRFKRLFHMIKLEPDPNDDVLDETEADTSVAVEQYAISSFGIDFDVEGLVRAC